MQIISSILSRKTQVEGDWGRSLRGAYPSPNDWKKYKKISKRDVYRFSRLWMSEGIPFAFRDAPICYERGREKMADMLGNDPKHINVTGSGRLGYSLAPKSFGRRFSPSSDFDIFIVSPGLFELLSKDAKLFVYRVHNHLATPSNNTEERWFLANALELPANIERGFINHKNIPARDMYPTSGRLSNALVEFSLSATGNRSGRPVYRQASVRVYRDWEVAISQIGGSLVYALKENGYIIV